MTAVKKLTKKALANNVQELYNIHFNRVQVKMLDIPKIYAEIERLILDVKTDLASEMTQLVERYEVC